MYASDSSDVAPDGTETSVEVFEELPRRPWLAQPAMLIEEPAAAWVTVKVRPAIVTVPVRSTPVALAGHEIVTDPEPVPAAGLTVSQDAALDAVHAQEDALAVRATDPLHAAEPADAEDPDSAKVHGGAAACVTV